MEEPNYENILKEKTDYYGETRAAYQFAAEEYARQYHSWMMSNKGNVIKPVCDICKGTGRIILMNQGNFPCRKCDGYGS
jgi:hypothetical protein